LRQNGQQYEKSDQRQVAATARNIDFDNASLSKEQISGKRNATEGIA
jgi:hypothetical protein